MAETRTNEAGRPGGPRRWIQRLALAGAGLVLSFLVFEVGLRVWSHFHYPRMMTVDRTLGWRHLPDRERVFTNEDGEENLVVQNEFGHRGAGHGRAKEAGVYRILVLGDSFTEAVHVGEEEVFTKRLERALEGTEVLNSGVGGWGTVQQYIYLREEGLAFEPDLVLVVSFANDLPDNCTPYAAGIGARPHAVLEGDEVRVVEDYDDAKFLRFVAPVPFRGFFVRNSYLFYAANDRLWQRMKRDEIRAAEAADRRALSEETMDTIFVAMMTRVHDLAAAEGIPVGLVLIPPSASVIAGEDAQTERVGAACAEAGIPTLSLLPAMLEARERGDEPYFETDIHWRNAGHAAAAEAILPFVRKLRERSR